MKLKSNSHYAISAIRTLYNSEKDVLSATEIAESENISKHFLRSILKVLNENGIVTITRGVKGGYKLNNIKDLSFKEILMIMNDKISVDFCCRYEEDKCKHMNNCKVSKVLKNIDNAFQKELSNIKIVDLL